MIEEMVELIEEKVKKCKQQVESVFSMKFLVSLPPKIDYALKSEIVSYLFLYI